MKKIHIKYDNYDETICGRNSNNVLIGTNVRKIPMNRICLVCAFTLGKPFFNELDIFHEIARRHREKILEFKDFDRDILSRI